MIKCEANKLVSSALSTWRFSTGKKRDVREVLGGGSRICARRSETLFGGV